LADIKVEVAKAQASADNAATSEENAANSANTATTKANSATASANNAASSATNAETYAKQAQSYAIGTGNARPNEASDNAKKYYEQSKEIYDNFSQAGNVMGVKGANESTYRTGLVNITAGNIGALPLSGGTITGDLRLKGAGNYGNKLNFGDGEYVYMYEYEDDKLEIKASTIKLTSTSNIECNNAIDTDITGNAATATNADTVDGMHARSFLPVDGVVSDGFWIRVENEWGQTNKDGYQMQAGSADNIHRWFLDGRYLEFNGGFHFAHMAPIGESIDLGLSYQRWKNVYAENGVIQTSDAKQKNSIAELSEQRASDFIMGLKPVTYKMNNGTSGRTHWGLISQDIEELMDSLGMESTDYAGFIKSPKIIMRTTDEDGNLLESPIKEVIEGEYEYSLRYDEFIAPLVKMVQMQQAEIETLKNDKARMEERLGIV
ncbi:MAG: tail fiber domain-containing protein, partial [Acetatifactor sp.]|nr:tail fiber domain-containing protein [Acetatifactor sp.]